MPVKWLAGEDEKTPLELKVRPLLVNNEIKDFTTGDSHEVSLDVIVVRHADRLNDSLPDDPKAVPRWRWQPGGWVMINRHTGHISKLNLPLFDPFYSSASWYRDLVAYCGVSDNGQKLFAVVAQIGRRKAILQRALGEAKGGDMPDSECAAPQWQRQPTRVTFLPKEGEHLSFNVRSFAVEIPTEATDDDPDAAKR